jgi:hypothetical protein
MINQLSREPGKAIEFSLGLSIIKNNVFRFNVAKLAQAVLECRDAIRVNCGTAGDQKAYPRKFAWLLRLSHSPTMR